MSDDDKAVFVIICACLINELYASTRNLILSTNNIFIAYILFCGRTIIIPYDIQQGSLQIET